MDPVEGSTGDAGERRGLVRTSRGNEWERRGSSGQGNEVSLGSNTNKSWSGKEEKTGELAPRFGCR